MYHNNTHCTSLWTLGAAGLLLGVRLSSRVRYTGGDFIGGTIVLLGISGEGWKR